MADYFPCVVWVDSSLAILLLLVVLLQVVNMVILFLDRATPVVFREERDD